LGLRDREADGSAIDVFDVDLEGARRDPVGHIVDEEVIVISSAHCATGRNIG